MTDGRIVIIDSDEKNATLLKSVLINRSYEVAIALNGRQGLDLFGENKYDIVYLDMNLSDIDPVDLVKEFRKRDIDIVIIAMLGAQSAQVIHEVIDYGFFDYTMKPLKLEEIYFKTKRAILNRKFSMNNRRALQGIEERNISLQKQNLMLAKRIEESTRNLTHLYEDLRETYMRTIKALAQAIDARDHYTHSHSKNVARYAEIMAREMELEPQKMDEIIDACQLHDLGKIGVHDYILTKPGKLTPEEYEEVKEHALKGAQILEPLQFLQGVIAIVRQHHERYDGTGYPYGLKGEKIEIGARVMQLADSYDAMVSARPYRQRGITKEDAIEEIKRGVGTQFDPKVVEIFLRVVKNF